MYKNQRYEAKVEEIADEVNSTLVSATDGKIGPE